MDGSVADVVSSTLERSGGAVATLVAIHRTNRPGEIADQLETVVEAVAGDVVSRCLFHVASVGSVTGVRLVDGSELVVKAYQPRWSSEFLEGVLATQSVLHEARLPCARPVGGPVRCGRGFATVETFVPDPGHGFRFGDVERRISARGLGELIAAVARDPRLDHHPLRVAAERLYPVPHNPMFDFDATVTGAGWIDDLAARARTHMAQGPLITAHTDWSARNVRFGPDQVLIIYDLDSLASVSLPTALGQAAATWRALGEANEATAPSLDEINDWLDHYPTQLTPAERMSAIAAAVWVLAYTARCEHAVDPDMARYRRARPRLRADAHLFQRLFPN